MASTDPGVQKCVAALKSAKNDTEKMAALFLVTKVVKAPKLDRASKLTLFESIGFKFLLRLLNSPSTPDIPALLYKSVSLSILTAFCSDPQIAEAPEMTDAIPTFLKIIEEGDDGGEDDQLLMVVNEAYHCLASVGATEKGSLALVKAGAVPRLVTLYSKTDADEAVEVVQSVAIHLGPRTWENYQDGFKTLMDRISLQFEADSSDQKFELCGLMAGLMTSCNLTPSALESAAWTSSILKGLSDILTSKITEKQRNPALRLASMMLTTLGVDWLVRESETPGKAYQFLVLLVNLACIEVRMTLEDRSIDKIMGKDDLIGSCYGIIEVTIRFIGGPGFGSLDEKQKEQVYHSLKGASTAILGFLNTLRIGYEKNPSYLDPKKKVLATASIRTLAAWLAEESGSVKEEVYKSLPFVLTLVFESFQDAELNQSVEAMTLAELGRSTSPLLPDNFCNLLPALCHLTAAEKGVRILLDAQGDQILNRFLAHNWSVYKNLKELGEKLSRPKKPGKVPEKGGKGGQGQPSIEELALTLTKLRAAINHTTNLFINISVLDPELAATSPIFQQVMRWAFSAAPSLSDPELELILLGNTSALGLLLLLDVIKRIQEAKGSGGTLTPEETFVSSSLISGSDNSVFRFGQAVVRFLWDAHLPDEAASPPSLELTHNYRSVWADIKEMWFLSLQTVGSLVGLLPWLGDFTAESGFLEAVISNISKAYKNRIDSSTLAAYEDFLIASLQGGPKAAKIMETKGAALAASHHLRGLKKALGGGGGGDAEGPGEEGK